MYIYIVNLKKVKDKVPVLNLTKHHVMKTYLLLNWAWYHEDMGGGGMLHTFLTSVEVNGQLYIPAALPMG